jgi:formylglycine-generating enzyme required for sulfatase activity
MSYRFVYQACVLAGFFVSLKVPGVQSSAPTANAAGIAFVSIPAGEFVMGCSPGDADCAAPEQPAHRVRITRPFEIAAHEITQRQWQAVMGSNPSYFKGDDLPVERVSWNDTQAFLEKLNATNDGYHYRLPTEAEWEYAARAGNTSAMPGEQSSVAWFDRNSEKASHRVGQKQPNAWGLYDTLGNVSEWVQDFFAVDYYSAATTADPSGPASGKNHVLRGGSWAGSSMQARVSYRVQMEPFSTNATIGFRCVRVPNNR